MCSLSQCGINGRVCCKLGLCWSRTPYLPLCSKTASATEQGCKADRSFHSSLFLCTARHEPVLCDAITSCTQASRQRVCQDLQNRFGFYYMNWSLCLPCPTPSNETHELPQRSLYLVTGHLRNITLSCSVMLAQALLLRVMITREGSVTVRVVGVSDINSPGTGWRVICAAATRG